MSESSWLMGSYDSEYFDDALLEIGQTLEAAGLLLIGLAKNGAGTWDIALNVDIG